MGVDNPPTIPPRGDRTACSIPAPTSMIFVERSGSVRFGFISEILGRMLVEHQSPSDNPAAPSQLYPTEETVGFDPATGKSAPAPGDLRRWAIRRPSAPSQPP